MDGVTCVLDLLPLGIPCIQVSCSPFLQVFAQKQCLHAHVHIKRLGTGIKKKMSSLLKYSLILHGSDGCMCGWNIMWYLVRGLFPICNKNLLIDGWVARCSYNVRKTFSTNVRLCFVLTSDKSAAPRFLSLLCPLVSDYHCHPAFCIADLCWLFYETGDGLFYKHPPTSPSEQSYL